MALPFSHPRTCKAKSEPENELARLRDDDLNGDRQQKDDNDRLQQLVRLLTRCEPRLRSIFNIVSRGALLTNVRQSGKNQKQLFSREDARLREIII
jgi:hypothetical protein